MPSRVAAITNKEISQLIKQAVSEIHEFGLEVLTGKALSFWLEFIDKTGQKVFRLPNANRGVHAHSCIMSNQGKMAGN